MAFSTPIPIDSTLYQQAEHDAQLSHRTVAQQIEFWARVGRAALENPDLPVTFIAESLQAKAFLDKGDLEQAEKLFKKSLTSKLAIVKEAAAEAFALAQIKDLQYETQEAIAYYQQSLQLDSDNADGWNRLGHLYRRIGELNQAIAAYQTVVKLGQTHNNQQEVAAAYGNLGLVYYTRGELDKAIDFYNKGLVIEESLGLKEGMAAKYGNLGLVYKTRGELDKAIEFHSKALAIDEQMGNKQGMAEDYGNLGAVYKQKGNKAEAKRYWQKSIELYKYIGSPNAKKYQNLLDNLK